MRKQQRIKKNEDFQQVFKHGTSFANRQFVVYIYSKKNQTELRLGLSVSKKLGNAVKRNEIKRYVRQAIFELQSELKANVDYVIIARAGATDLNFHETKKSLQHILRIAKCLPKVRNEVK